MTLEMWGAKWISCNKLDGRRKHLIYENGMPVVFHTRSATRAFIKTKYGYIATRADLREEPHGWRLPSPVRVRVTVTESKTTRHANSSRGEKL